MLHPWGIRQGAAQLSDITTAVQSNAPHTAVIQANVAFPVKPVNISPVKYMVLERVPLNSHELYNAQGKSQVYWVDYGDRVLIFLSEIVIFQPGFAN